jgi:DNA-binding MarR family transcriptional regulator
VSTVPKARRHFIGSLSRLVWQWVRQQIQIQVVAAGFDDLNPAHIGVFRNPGIEGRRPGELAAEMQITKQSVNELLGHLERRGYLTREVDPADSRSRLIRMTERGRALSAVIIRAAEQAEVTAGGLIGEDRMAEVVGALTELVEQLGLAGTPGSAVDPAADHAADHAAGRRR